MSGFATKYNSHVRCINKCVERQKQLAQRATLGELGKKPKLTKAQKVEQKNLRKIEEKERRALIAMTPKKERVKIAKELKKARKQLKSATGFIGDLNDAKPVTLPLTIEEEKFRVASVSDDFNTMDLMAPFGLTAWQKNTPLGKYRFVIQGDKMIFIPWTESSIDKFLAGPWLQRDPATGIAPLIHPRRKVKPDFLKVKKAYIEKQNKLAAKIPNTNSKHVFSINPGNYIFDMANESTLDKIKKPVLIAAAVVAAVYLGPAALNAIKGAYAGIGSAGAATGTAAGAEAATASLGAKIFAGAKTLTGYVNNARTVQAIAKGEMPPPPVGVTGESFREWAFDVAKKEAIDEYGRQLTKEEEKEMRREIEILQRELAPYVENIPLDPSPELPQEIRNIQAIQEKRTNELNNLLLPAAIIAGALIFGA